jgi:hypothetical protein
MTPMRSPVASAQHIDDQIWVEDQLLGELANPNDTIEVQCNRRGSLPSNLTRALRFRHAKGVPVRELAQRVTAGVDELGAATDFLAVHKPGWPPVHFRTEYGAGLRGALMWLTLTACLCHDARTVERWAAMVDNNGGSVLLEGLLRAFVQPLHGKALPKFRKPERWPFTKGILQVLQQPVPARAAAMAAHMARWPRFMRPFDLTLAEQHRFADFAFEVALAVCAYDIDDAALRAHAFYPHELADHYRAHLRQTRDAWRACGAGAGVPVALPEAKRVRVDLAASKLKGFARWAQIAVGGDKQALADVMDAVGKPRKLAGLDEVMSAIAEAQYALHADIKDDVTLALQIEQLFEAWGLAGFDPPDEPPAGPARCSALLSAARAWAGARGLALIELDNQDDAWHAVLVPSDWREVWLGLCEALGVRVENPAAL